MRPLVNAIFAGRFSDFLRFDLESGWQCRIVVLADHLVRVLFLRNGTLKEPRTWMVAPADAPMPWEGTRSARPERLRAPRIRRRRG